MAAPPPLWEQMRGVLPLVSIAVGVLALLALVNLFGMFVPAEKKRKRHSRKLTTSVHQFRAMDSALDPGGSLILSWSSPRSRLVGSGLWGWYSFTFISSAFWMCSTMYFNWESRSGSSVFKDGGMFFGALVESAWGLLLAVLVQCAVFGCGFVVQRLVTDGAIRSLELQLALQYGLEIALMGGSLAFCRHHQGWPVSAKLGLMLQATVLICKLHSYLDTNRRMARQEKEKGEGEGEGKVGKGEEGEGGEGKRAESKGRRRRGRRREGDGGRVGRVVGESSGEEETDKDPLYGQGTGEDVVVPKYRLSSSASHHYPGNVTFSNFVEFGFMPVLVYELEYPRTSSIRVSYLVEKVVLGLYLIVLGSLIVTEHLNPHIHLAVSGDVVELVVRFLAPVTSIFLIVFLIIFEATCNFLAEVTYLADREFYGPFWNATTFQEFARLWNKPVHEFLLRVYLALQAEHGWSADSARYTTFLLSMIFHELIAFGMFGLAVPWLGLFSVFQFPLMGLMRSPYFKGKRLGNLVFWVGILIGIAIVGVLYAREYCVEKPHHCTKFLKHYRDPASSLQQELKQCKRQLQQLMS